MFRPDWYRAAAVADLVKEYYWVLRSALRAHPHLRPCLTRCRHCHIFFLTHPRNARRQDLRCPFGCREAHRKRESTKRSVAYYQGEEGRKYRRVQNGNRQRTGPAPGPEPPSPPPVPVAVPEACPHPWPTPLFRYLRMVIGLMEGRSVHQEELRALLAKVLRQPSIGGRRKIGYRRGRWQEPPT